jgi:hypothetical protein
VQLTILPTESLVYAPPRWLGTQENIWQTEPVGSGVFSRC